MTRSVRGRHRVGSVLAALLGLLVVAMYAPMPVYALWLGRFVARELALAGVLVATGAALLLSRSVLRLGVALAGLAAALPVLLALPLFSRLGVPFSLRQYATGAPAPAVPVEVLHDVVLDESRPELLVDVYRGPSPAAPRPFVLVLHGGSWIRGDKGDVPQVSRHLAAAGFIVFDVRYRLSPASPFPAAVGDVKCALGLLRRQSLHYGLDGRRAALLGRSAGGQLALLAAYSVGDGRLPPSCPVADEPVEAVVALYPFTDLVRAYQQPPRPDPEETREVLLSHLGAPPATAEALYRYQLASPSSFVSSTRRLPRTLLLHGASDMLVPHWHSATLQNAMSAAGQEDRATLITVPLADHGFDFRPGGVGEQLERALVPPFLTATAGPRP